MPAMVRAIKVDVGTILDDGPTIQDTNSWTNSRIPDKIE
jgi:hypothetical protein